MKQHLSGSKQEKQSETSVDNYNQTDEFSEESMVLKKGRIMGFLEFADGIAF